MSEYHGLKFHGQKEQEQIAALRSQLAAAEADRATWQQRATSAERRVEELRGELIVLRQALDARQATFDHNMRCLECAEPEEQCEEGANLDDRAAQLHAQARDGTDRSAQLGALIEAALEETRLERAIANEQAKPGITMSGLELVKAIVHARGARRDAADAVLASEVRT